MISSFLPHSKQPDTGGSSIKHSLLCEGRALEVFSSRVSERLNPWQLKEVRLTGAQPLQHFICLKLQPGEEDKDTVITDAALLPFSVGPCVLTFSQPESDLWDMQQPETYHRVKGLNPAGELNRWLSGCFTVDLNEEGRTGKSKYGRRQRVLGCNES